MSENAAEAENTGADANEAENEETSAEKAVESRYSSRGETGEESNEAEEYANDNEPKYDAKSKGKSKSAAKGKDISDKVKDKEDGDSIDSRARTFLDDDLDESIERNLEKQDVAWKELWYIVKGFLNTGSREEDEKVYKIIAAKAKNGEPLTFLLPGLFQFPYTARDFEKYSGLDTVRIATRNPDEIHNILSYAAQKTRTGSILIGYSDGELRARDYVKKFGDSKLSMFYGLESDKSHMERIMDPNRVRYIDGDGFLVRTLSPWGIRDFYAPTNAPLDKINGASHSGLMHNQYDIARVGKIIRETARIKYSNFVQMGTPINDNIIKPLRFDFKKAA